MTLFTILPWPVFVGCWIAFLALVYVWLVGPWWLPLLAFAPFLIELRMANVHLLLAAAIVLGFRWPATWAFVLLTKVTPGIGLLWFAGWLFTIGYLGLGFWQGLLGLIVWPYFLGAYFAPVL